MTKGNETRAALLASVLLLGLGLLPASRAWAQAGAPLPIRIGYQTSADWLAMAGRELKLFEKAGLAPTQVKFAAGAPMIVAAESNSIDVSTPGTVPFLAGLASGVDWVVIGIDTEAPTSEGFVARMGSGIEKLSDLRGRKIGYFRASTAHYGLLQALRKNNISPGEVTMLHMAPAQQLAAMLNKEIDAAVVWEPWLLKLANQANGKIIAREADIGVHTALVVFAVRRDWLKANREAARRFVMAVLMAYDGLEKDRSIVVKKFAQEVAIQEEWAESMYKQAGPPKIYRWADKEYPYSIVKGSVFHKSLADLAEFLYEEKVIRRKVDVNDVLDSSVIVEVLKTWRKGQ